MIWSFGVVFFEMVFGQSPFGGSPGNPPPKDASTGQLLIDELISERYPLEQINEAYAALLGGGFKRGVIVFDEATA